MPNRPDGNRQDNRQRGNAAQLLEKYKALARDSQLAGDRVQTEYYLQFADHYFRVLEDGRSRFEEQNQRRPRQDDDDDDGEEAVGADTDLGDEDGEDEPRQPPRRDRAPQRDRAEQQEPRGDRPQRNDRADRDRPERGDRAEGNRSEANRSERPRRERAEHEQGDGEERIPLGVLPPAIGVSGDDGEAEAPRPRRRVRKPRDEDGDDIAPAA